MSEEHIPAWKRILSKKQNISSSFNPVTEDPLNVTTHLATGSLTRKEKKQIINKSNTTLNAKKNKVHKKTKKDRKKEKLPKAERELRKNKVLKDQLRYLIEFYRFKKDKKLPELLYTLESVKSNYPEDLDNEVDESKDVVDIWKFSKQKQNWLIKHILNLDEVPSHYDDLLISYFQDIQGRSRNELLDKARSIITEWNKYAIEQEEKIKGIVEGNDEEAEKKEEKDGAAKDESDETEEDKTKTEEKPEELPMPNKARVSRSYKLVKAMANGDETLSSIELKNFQLD
ncbi:hypothetical protein MOUN0_I03356 [Monosporozyma unispora]|nr:hypothetical protein C6P44_001558 [Kazachstania unispora]